MERHFWTHPWPCLDWQNTRGSAQRAWEWQRNFRLPSSDWQISPSLIKGHICAWLNSLLALVRQQTGRLLKSSQSVSFSCEHHALVFACSYRMIGNFKGASSQRRISWLNTPSILTAFCRELIGNCILRYWPRPKGGWLIKSNQQVFFSIRPVKCLPSLVCRYQWMPCGWPQLLWKRRLSQYDRFSHVLLSTGLCGQWRFLQWWASCDNSSSWFLQLPMILTP